MKVDFRKIPVETLDGTTEEKDIAHWLGNAIRQQTTDIGEDDLACAIYRQGEADLTPEQAEVVKNYAKKAGLLAYIQRGLEQQLTIDN